MRDLFLIAGVAACAFVALRRPVFGFSVYLALSLFSPQSFTWGIARTFPLSQMMVAGTIVGLLFWSEPWTIPHRQREFRLVLLLWGIFAFSTSTAFHPTKALDAFVSISKILFMTVLTTVLITTEERLRLVLRIIALTIGFYGAKGGLFALLGGGENLVFGPDLNFLSANNAIGMALALNVPILFYLIKQEANLYLRRLMWAMLILSYPATIFTYSRGAWLGLAGATGILVLQSRRRYGAFILACMIVLAVMPLVSTIAPDRLKTRYDSLINYEADGSAQSRFWNWEFCMRVGSARPMAGAGFDFYGLDAYEEFFPEFLTAIPGKVWSCHNAALSILAEHGVLGLAIWIGLLLSMFLSLGQIRAVARMHPRSDQFRAYANMLTASLVVFCLAGMFLDIAYFEIFFQLVACVIVCRRLLDTGLVKASGANRAAIRESPRVDRQS
jgi:probable O-glycosylation ligase (exosortase A-associated)